MLHKKLGYGKLGVPRHTRFSKSSAHRCEKVIETKMRRNGKRECLGN